MRSGLYLTRKIIGLTVIHTWNKQDTLATVNWVRDHRDFNQASIIGWSQVRTWINDSGIINPGAGVWIGTGWIDSSDAGAGLPTTDIGDGSLWNYL